MSSNKYNNTQNDKKENGTFKKKNIKHGQQESSRSIFKNQGEDETK